MTEARRKVLALGLTAAGLYGLYETNVRVQSHLGAAQVKAAGLAGTDLPSALARARAESKPVLAEVAAIWCPTCRAFDASVLSDPKTNAFIRERFVYTRLEYESDEGRAFAARYGVRSFPRFVVLDAAGVLRGRVEADFDAGAFRARLESLSVASRAHPNPV